MPLFGDYETVGEPLAISEQGSYISTVWKVRRMGASGGEFCAIKCFARIGNEGGDQQQETLGADAGLEFLETVKHLKKAHSDARKTGSPASRCLAPIHEFGASPEGVWYRTDLYQRTTNSLKAWIAVRGLVDSAALRHVVYSIVSGCLALQRSCGRSHGNLKPSNVFLAGKPRQALRKTPLQLVDPLPASLFRAPDLDTGDRQTVLQLIREISEAQDLQAIGLIILQLVEGREIQRSEYNYPIDRSSSWDKLGKEGEQWRGLCNRLLDPHLSLIDVNLESLAKEFRPSQWAGLPVKVTTTVVESVSSALGNVAGAKWLPKAAAAAGAICLVIVIGISLSSVMSRSREAKFQKLISLARQEFDASDFEKAQADLMRALRIKPQDAEGRNLLAQVEQKQSERRSELTRSYDSAMKAAQTAFTATKLDEALRQTGEALKYKPGDSAAKSLAQQIEQEKARQEQIANVSRAYDSAMKAAQTAFTATKLDEALRQTGEALKYKPGDSAAKSLAQQIEQEKARQEQVARANKAYEVAMKAARDALSVTNLDETTKQVSLALGARPGDPAAGNLSRQVSELKHAIEADRTYRAAMLAAREGLNATNFVDAVQQVNAALTSKPGDGAAIALKEQITLASDFQLAQSYFDQCHLSDARKMCSSHPGIQPFDMLKVKIDTKGKQIEKVLADFDVMLVQFNVLGAKHKSIQSSEGKKASVLGSIGTQKTNYFRYAEDLERRYKSCPPEDGREKLFKDLKDHISRWD